ncbi:hypothetical protein SAMN05421811_13020 [Nonomuraea wenchangensis]|uniref:Uncharacterized protein n=1 Tax=Nonomuraea wenchangensis TaxID=568860 RepID=A0A1I0LVG8_9ACTN|nr:hypothetical protein SAMN05421811_13020 [Nonomuraea wenchangensis]
MVTTYLDSFERVWEQAGPYKSIRSHCDITDMNSQTAL